MTPSASRAVLAIAVLSGGCFDAPLGTFSDEQKVQTFLESVKHYAPLQATFDSGDAEGAVCEVPDWETAFPDQPSRVWGQIQRSELDAVSYSDGVLGTQAPSWVVGLGGNLDRIDKTSALVFVARWAGEATITCRGDPISDAYVVVDDSSQIESNTRVAREELIERASANVAEAGLGEVVDRDLSYAGADCSSDEGTCAHDAGL